MTAIQPDKYYQFIKSYPFQWRYYKGPYNTLIEANHALVNGRTVSARCVMLGSEYLKKRTEWEFQLKKVIKVWTKEQELKDILNISKWPYYPWLPMKRQAKFSPNTGTLYHKYENVFEFATVNIFDIEAMKTALWQPIEIEKLLDEGWYID